MKVKKENKINISFAGKGELFNTTIMNFFKDENFIIKAIYDISNSKLLIDNSLVYVDSLDELVKYKVDVCFLVEYPKIIPEKYLNKLRFINSHGGLLPEYRGFHGNVWAMINGERFLGYTIHRVNKFFDAGPIIYQKKVSTNNSKTYYELKTLFMNHWKKNIKTIIKKYVDSGYRDRPQNEKKALYVGKRNIDDCRIDWSWDSRTIFNFIRTLSPPFTEGAFTTFKGQKIYILKSKLVDCRSYIETPGKIVNNNNDGIFVKSGDSLINITQISFLSKVYKPQNFFKTVGARLE